MLTQKLQQLIGQRFDYLSEQWLLIEVLSDEDRIVLQRESGSHEPLQGNQFGQAKRRVAETLCLPISATDDADSYSEELLLLLSGRHR